MTRPRRKRLDALVDKRTHETIATWAHALQCDEGEAVAKLVRYADRAMRLAARAELNPKQRARCAANWDVVDDMQEAVTYACRDCGGRGMRVGSNPCPQCGSGGSVDERAP